MSIVFRPHIFTANIGIREQDEIEKIVAHLKNKGYIPTIRKMLSEGFRIANGQEPDRNSILKLIYDRYLDETEGFIGEVFFVDKFIIMLSPTAEDTSICIIGYEDPEPVKQNFTNLIEEAIKARFDGRRLRGMEFIWNKTKAPTIRLQSRAYERRVSKEDPNLSFTVPKYDKTDLDASCILADEIVRDFLINLAKIKKMFSASIPNDFSYLDELIKFDLISKEYLVSCRNDKRTICIVQTKDSLNNPNAPPLRCPNCNRCLSEEEISEVFTITKRGKELADGSMWMSVWFTELLEKNGIAHDTIKWKMEANGEELDIMVEDFGSRLFVELKDREFGLSDMYNFSSRVSRYDGTDGIIATADVISPDTKKFIGEQSGQRGFQFQLTTLEGQNVIENSIAKVIKNLSFRQIRRTINPLTNRISLDLWPVIELWMNRTIVKATIPVVRPLDIT